MNGSGRLSENIFKSSYDSFEDQPVQDFFIPSLRTAVVYRRAVGYFSSAIITVLAEAFTNFSERGGSFELICSPVLTPGDADTLERITEEAALESLNSSIDILDNDGLMQPPLNLMACLIRNGTLKIKLAIPMNTSSGMFHQKIGLFKDASGAVVAFSGSNNESVSGWMDMKNSESFSVFTSWRDDNDSERAMRIESSLDKMWNNVYRGFEIVDAAKGLKFIERRSREDSQIADVKKFAREWYEKRTVRVHSIAEPRLRPYQSDVLDNWAERNYKGIVCFATGAGKTITALAAAQKWLGLVSGGVVIVLVPTIRLQHQWAEEIRKFGPLCGLDLMLVGGDGVPEWVSGLRSFTSSSDGSSGAIVLAVNNSATKSTFYNRVSWGNHVLLIADEVHNLGAEGALPLFERAEFGGVLGLSATPKRYNDDENERIREIFGADLLPVVDIPYAQDLGVLVRYRYRFETVDLTDGELEDYDSLTKHIGKLLRARSDDSTMSKSLRFVLAKRANILKNAEGKVGVATNIIRREYVKGSSWLVFCNDQVQLAALKANIPDLSPLDYHGAADGGQDETLDLFEQDGGILLSIRMLDEGIDIPSVDHCLILASSKNERQFIQRRGRVLRVRKERAKVAEIWDLLVVDRDGRPFDQGEAARAVEFGRMALNPSVVDPLLDMRDNQQDVPSD